MSGIVALPPTSPAPTAPDDVIDGDGWFPDVKMSEIREEMRVKDVVTPLRLRQATSAAMMTVMRGLAAWKAEQLLAAAEKLEDVEADQVGGLSVLVQLYRRAVYSFAMADLAETHRNQSATTQGGDRAEEVELTADDHRRNAAWAISDIVGRPRTTIELI